MSVFDFVKNLYHNEVNNLQNLGNDVVHPVQQLAQNVQQVIHPPATHILPPTQIDGPNTPPSFHFQGTHQPINQNGENWQFISRSVGLPQNMNIHSPVIPNQIHPPAGWTYGNVGNGMYGWRDEGGVPGILPGYNGGKPIFAQPQYLKPNTLQDFKNGTYRLI